MTKIIHRGNREQRAADLMPERVFAEIWQDENQRRPAINHGYGALELILNFQPLPPGPWNWQPPIDPITQRDATVAASVIQWLGTQAGAAFLMRVEARMEEEQAKEMAAYNAQWNKPLTMTLVE